MFCSFVRCHNFLDKSETNARVERTRAKKKKANTQRRQETAWENRVGEFAFCRFFISVALLCRAFVPIVFILYFVYFFFSLCFTFNVRCSNRFRCTHTFRFQQTRLKVIDFVAHVCVNAVVVVTVTVVDRQNYCRRRCYAAANSKCCTAPEQHRTSRHSTIYTNTNESIESKNTRE